MQLTTPLRHNTTVNGKRVRTPTFNSWRMMKERCQRTGHPHYNDYGGRGILVCERWQDYENFLADMGERPTAYHSLERREVNGNYERANCFWATPTQQCNNRRSNRIVTIKGETLTVSQAVDKYGVRKHYFGIIKKLNKGWDALAAIEHFGARP